MIDSRIINKKEDFIVYPTANDYEVNNQIEAVFFDRDGVIIEDCHYIKNAEQVKLCPGAKELIRHFYNQNILVIIITNQSGISKNLITWVDYYNVNNRMIKLLGFPNPVRAVLSNSYEKHKPINWRKPNPQMILKASKDFNINCSKSILIGDRSSDIVAGIRANIPKLFHVMTGHGKKERPYIKRMINKFKNHNEKVKFDLKYIDNLNSFPLKFLNI